MLDILVQENIPSKLSHAGRESVLMSQLPHRPKRVYRRKIGRQEDQTWSQYQYLAQMDNYIKRRISFDHHYLTQLQRQQLISQHPFHQQLQHQQFPKSLQQQQQEWFGKSFSTGFISEIRDENGILISDDPETLKELKGADVVGVYYMYKGWSNHGEEPKGEVGVTLEGGNLGMRPPIQPSSQQYDPEWTRMEAWLDDHQDFAADYFIRKASRHMVDCWLVSHALPQNPTGSLATSGSSTQGGGASGAVVTEGYATHQAASRQSSGATTPVRKISAHEFEKGGLLKPIVTTIDGTPTFLSPAVNSNNLALVAKVRRKSRTELKGLDERQLIFELVKDICNDLDIKSLCHKILQNVSILTNADRCSLFLVQGEKDAPNRYLVSTLFDVNPDSTLEEVQDKEEIRVAWGSGIIGYVAEKGEVVNIPDAYQDERFNQEIDIKTGYKTRSLLCMPIKDSSGEVVGVAQVINKQLEGTFTSNDEKVFESYLQFCGIGLKNAQLYERSQLEVKRNQVLLDLARIIFEEQSTIEQMVYRIMTHTQSLLQCERVQVLLVHEASQGSFSRVFDLEVKDLQEEDANARTSPFESRFPINIGITGHVAATGETVNITDAYEDPRFDKSVDSGGSFRHKSILCMPIRNTAKKIVGVVQLINKFADLPFTSNDENFLEAFSIFCGMGIHNTHMYESAIVAMAKQKVTLEVLSYHAAAPKEEADKLKKSKVPSAQALKLYDFKFDDFSLDDDGSLRACLRMFLDLDLIERFHIDYDTLCRWLLSVKKNYRHVTYHNWRHAFNVAQMMFAIITKTQWWKMLGEVECMSLIIACLCHDLDHRGTNNSFQIKASSPLAQLYSTSTMEHHHFDQCIMILNSAGNQILSQVTSEEFSRIINVLENAILATDLAIYFKNRGSFLTKISNNNYDWQDESDRAILRGMMMTICDIAAITKPWTVQKKVAELVASEFFEQGDIEKEKLHITPIDMMNRDKKEELPIMQVRFIDSICLPIYEAFEQLSTDLKPLVDGVNDNRKKWLQLAEKNKRQERSSTEPTTPTTRSNNNNNQ